MAFTPPLKYPDSFWAYNLLWAVNRILMRLVVFEIYKQISICLPIIQWMNQCTFFGHDVAFSSFSSVSWVLTSQWGCNSVLLFWWLSPSLTVQLLTIFFSLSIWKRRKEVFFWSDPLSWSVIVNSRSIYHTIVLQPWSDQCIHTTAVFIKLARTQNKEFTPAPWLCGDENRTFVSLPVQIFWRNFSYLSNLLRAWFCMTRQYIQL